MKARAVHEVASLRWGGREQVRVNYSIRGDKKELASVVACLGTHSVRAHAGLSMRTKGASRSKCGEALSSSQKERGRPSWHRPRLAR
jgi:hypothetical protein